MIIWKRSITANAIFASKTTQPRSNMTTTSLRHTCLGAPNAAKLRNSDDVIEVETLNLNIVIVIMNYKFDKRGKLLSHLRNDHKKKTVEDVKKVDDEPSTYIKEEHRQLKNNFERLNTLFQESLEEVDRVKSEYTAMLV